LYHFAVILHFRCDGRSKAAGGYTALISALSDDHPEVVRALLSAGADVNAKAFNGETAMSLAKQGGHPEVVQLLKASRALPDK
jgi:uncharacterized protein